MFNRLLSKSSKIEINQDQDLFIENWNLIAELANKRISKKNKGQHLKIPKLSTRGNCSGLTNARIYFVTLGMKEEFHSFIKKVNQGKIKKIADDIISSESSANKLLNFIATVKSFQETWEDNKWSQFKDELYFDSNVTLIKNNNDIEKLLNTMQVGDKIRIHSLHHVMSVTHISDTEWEFYDPNSAKYVTDNVKKVALEMIHSFNINLISQILLAAPQWRIDKHILGASYYLIYTFAKAILPEKFYTKLLSPVAAIFTFITNKQIAKEETVSNEPRPLPNKEEDNNIPKLEQRNNSISSLFKLIKPHLSHENLGAYYIFVHQLENLKTLITTKKLDVNKKWTLTGSEFKKWYPIEFAIYAKAPDIVEYLLKDCHVNVNIPLDSLSMTPLMYAASIFVYSGDLEIINVLLQHGADINKKDKKGKTALHYAVENGNPDLVALLLRKGASVTSADKDGNTPLHFAAKNHDSRLVDLLLKKGADRWNAKNKEKLLPIAIALLNGCIETFTALSKGMKLDKDNIKSLIPTKLNKEQQHNVAKVLREAQQISVEQPQSSHPIKS